MFRIVCEPVPEKGVYRLVQSTIIEGVHIAAGYEWNGASIPCFLWPIIGSPFDPRFMAPALAHDKVYDTGELTRKQADQLFRKLLIHNGVDIERAETMYAGVQLFGRSHYNKGIYHA